MDWLNIFGLAVGLAMDALAVSIATGLTLPQVTHRHVFRMAFHFGLFQFFMPIIGYFAGKTVANYISGYDHWLAFGLLTIIGAKMLWESREAHKPENRGDPTRGLMLLTLSVATSIDALAVGLSMAFINVSIWTPSIVIGLVAATLTAVGICFGSRIGHRFGKIAEIGGGLILIAIGVKILIDHLSV
ncbi:MAG: manganese efflux pump [Planctomycetaceae bacterium]|nr:MAG: manganese efflux pump [Planctomycetaceae bacterium]